ncbi:hypothetical protein VIBNIFTn2_1110001 [Vibrio nigripulchritudo FTn2]|nr:hypothetical protein VIBNIFTn2_1110001 [Vibrio nigripulchritudo FTn2]
MKDQAEQNSQLTQSLTDSQKSQAKAEGQAETLKVELESIRSTNSGKA